MDFIHYMGHSGFEISLKGVTILIDPFFGAGLKEQCELEVILRPSDIKRADLILLTHEHPSHADPGAVWEIAERTGASVVAPIQTLSRISLSERQKVDVRVGDKFNLKGIDITVTKATHPQSVYAVGYVIKDTVSIYHAGDTYQFNEMMGMSVDYALVPIGGSYTMDPIDAANACRMLKAKYIIPMHYNTYNKIHQNVNDFARRIQRGKVIILKPDDLMPIKP
ncbi:MAG: metal-dependent hydrolase [Candidatus Micrarchaeia archaeon]